MTTREDRFGIEHSADLALTAAAYHCDPLGIARALRGGALVDVASRNGFTPLMWVCFRGSAGFDPVVSVRWLLAAGADINHIGGRPPCTPLTIACEMQDVQLVELILRNGGDPNPPSYVDSPLHNAVPSLDVVRLLVGAGADKTRLSRGQTALERYVEGRVEPTSEQRGADAEMTALLGR